MEDIRIYTISNSKGMKAEVLNYGATIANLYVPDNNGKITDVLLGYESVKDYLRDDNPYFNATVGRYANRIANSRFLLNDKMYVLNSGGSKHCLHSGPTGMSRKYWKLVHHSANKVVLSCLSPDGEGGFPGNLAVEASFLIGEDNSLEIHYTSVCDQPCPVSLTFHGYFNLGADSIRNHRLTVMCDTFLETDHDLIPTGQRSPVEKLHAALKDGLPLDQLLNYDIELDHCFESTGKGDICRVASLSAENLSMDVESNLPGLQVYTGNGLHGGILGVKKSGGYHAYDGICFEAQYYPDAPNQPHFPDPVIKPAAHRTDIIRYRFY